MASIVIPQGARRKKFGQAQMPMAKESFLIGALEQSCRALSSPNAHGDHAVARFAASHFVGNGANHARTGHSEGMSDGDRAAVNIELFRIDAQAVAAINYLNGESLVQFPQIQIAHSQGATT